MHIHRTEIVTTMSLSPQGAKDLLNIRHQQVISEIIGFLEVCVTHSTRDKKAKFANSLDLVEVAQNEPPHLDLQCLPSSLCTLNMI